MPAEAAAARRRSGGLGGLGPHRITELRMEVMAALETQISKDVKRTPDYSYFRDGDGAVLAAPADARPVRVLAASKAWTRRGVLPARRAAAAAPTRTR